jgi:hypothetical protein
LEIDKARALSGKLIMFAYRSNLFPGGILSELFKLVDVETLEKGKFKKRMETFLQLISSYKTEFGAFNYTWMVYWSNKSIVFDWEQYLQNYPELLTYGINTQKKALDHFMNYGKNEGRTSNPLINFDWKQYISNYPDLVQGGIDTQDKAIIHFISHGQNEGRNDKVPYIKKPEVRVPIMNNLDLLNDMYTKISDIKFKTDFDKPLLNRSIQIMALNNKYQKRTDPKQPRILKFYNGQDLNKDQLSECKQNKVRYERSEIMTIHKSQGSSIDHVVLIINKPMNYNMFYTAITRAKNNLTILIHDKITQLFEQQKIKFNEMMTINDDKFNLLFEIFRISAQSVYCYDGKPIGQGAIKTKNKPHELYDYLTKSKMNWTRDLINGYWNQIISIKRSDLVQKINNDYGKQVIDLFSLFCEEYRKKFS